MSYKEAVREFKRTLPNGKHDYWSIQLWWTGFVDDLCKAGIISQKQFNVWNTPFEYGRSVLVFDRKVVQQL